MRPIRRLIEITKDSYNYKYNFENTPPNEVILFITSLCNFACETCFYSEKLNDTKNDLTFEIFESGHTISQKNLLNLIDWIEKTKI